MSNHIQIGQLFLVGFQGTSLQPGCWVDRAIHRHGLGGVILFDRNVSGATQNFNSPEGLRKIVGSLKDFAENLLIGVDQEGGKVCRLREQDGFAPCLGAASLADLGRDRARRQAAEMAEMLAHYGINLNFAPVIDLNLYPENPAIGSFGRSYGSSAQEVAAFAELFVREHHRFHVGCCIKHFPGHGSSRKDSHLGFVDITDYWNQAELEPYRLLIANGYCDGVMSGHLVHRGLDPTGLPATLSTAMMDDLLRRQLHFSGVVFSDDLQMAAITRGWSYREAVQRAFVAGVDMLVVGNNLDNQEDAVEEGVKAITALLHSGKITEERLHQSIDRVQLFKKKIAGEVSWQNSGHHTT